jgi:hypothetical protein
VIHILSATILLHNPHAHVSSPGCVSAFKILEASRSILDLIYAVRSTSFDITLLDFFCAVRFLLRAIFRIADVNLRQFCWFTAGRVLIRFWKATQDANSEEQSLSLRAQVAYIMCGMFSPRSWLNRSSLRHQFCSC